MKKNTLSIISMVAMLIIFGACQKEELSELNIKKNSTPTKSIGIQSEPIPIGGGTNEYERWDHYESKCVTTTEYICCSPPPPDPALALLELYSDFEVAFDNNNVSDFFTNYPYNNLWSNLSSQSSIVSDLINGTNRMIKVHNNTNNIDYYLIGEASLTDTQIQSNPLWVVYVNW